MVVALRTPQRAPQPHFGHIPHPIGLVDRPVFLDLEAAFVGGLQEAVVGGSQHMVVGMFSLGGLDQITRQLQECEAVEGEILEKGVDHPVAVGRSAVGLITVVADCVGIPHEIEPPTGQPLGMPRRGQEMVDPSLPRLRRHICQERLHFLWCGWQPGQVQVQSPHEGHRVCILRRLEPFLTKPLRHKGIDPRHRPAVFMLRSRPGEGRYIGPVRGILRPRGHPRLQECPLFLGELVVALWGRHQEIVVRRPDPDQEFTLLGVAGHNRPRSALQRSGCCLSQVKTQPGLAFVLVRSVAGEAVAGEDRPNVAIEVRRLRDHPCDRQ